MEGKSSSSQSNKDWLISILRERDQSNNDWLISILRERDQSNKDWLISILSDQASKKPILSDQSNKDWLISIWSDQTQEKRETHALKKPKIQLVPRLLRENQSNKDCYEPNVVSIGPYHHGKPELQLVEMLKPLSLRKLLGKKNIDDQEKLMDTFAKARAEYAEGSTAKFSNDEEFARMMLLDGCFLLHYINCYLSGNYHEMHMNIQHVAYVLRDLFLLENQLPYIVLDELIKQTTTPDSGRKNIGAFIRAQLSIPRKRQRKDTYQSKDAEPLHLLDLLWTELVGNDHPSSPQTASRTSSESPTNIEYTFRSAKELETAGVRCKKSDTSFLKDVHFRSHRIFGSLSLPPVVVDDLFKPKFLNLIAYETCPDSTIDHAVTSYICFMDSLIDEVEDVKVLRSKGVLLNRLGSDEQVADLFNKIATDLLSDPQDYAEAIVGIEKHCSNKKNIWMAEAWNTHFSSPWTFVAFVAAILVIVLTMLQTYFAINPLK